MTHTYYAADPSLPPPGEFNTFDAWLAALPRWTVLMHEYPNGMTVPVLVEDVIDGLAMAPFMRAMLRTLIDEAGA